MEIENANGIRIMLERLDPPAEVRAVVKAIEDAKGGSIGNCPPRGLQIVRQIKAYMAGDTLCDAILAHVFDSAKLPEDEETEEPAELTTIDKALEAGYKIESKNGGWHTVTGPAMPEPKKVQGDDNLDELLVDLMARELEDE